MKSLISLFLLASCAVFVFGQEAEPTAPRALFKVVPQSFIVGELKVGTEFFNKQRTKSYSVYVYGRVNNGNDDNYYDENSYRGLGGEFQYRKYISPIKSVTSRRGKTYQQGAYISGYAQAASYTRKDEFVYYTYDPTLGQSYNSSVRLRESVGNWGGGFTFGVQRTFWNVIYVDAYLGGGIQWSDVISTYTPALPQRYSPEYSSITSPRYQGIMPKFGINIGVAL